MTATELAALGLRVKPLEFGSDQLAIDHSGGTYELCDEDDEFWVTYSKRLAQYDDCTVLKGPNRTEAEAIAAANTHNAAQVAAMIERTK